MNNTEDSDIIELQNRLQFTKGIQVRHREHTQFVNIRLFLLQPVVLTGRNRHIIFSGVLLLQDENKSYIEVSLTNEYLLNKLASVCRHGPFS